MENTALPPGHRAGPAARPPRQATGQRPLDGSDPLWGCWTRSLTVKRLALPSQGTLGGDPEWGPPVTALPAPCP